jgi:3-oxoacyl-[acyl-carrier protein] reductase
METAIITGGANGIGLAACERFAQEGAHVIMADFDETVGREREAEFTGKGLDVTFVPVDVVNRTSVTQLVGKTLVRFGQIDILINNAGITRDATLVKMELADFQRVLDVNLTGVFNCTRPLSHI